MPINNPSESEAFQKKSMERLIIERERLNEKKYRTMYTDLLKQNRGLLDITVDRKDDYKEETELIKKALATQRNAFIMGITVGLSTFVSLRYLPRFFIRRFGSESRIKALQEADVKAKESWITGLPGLLIESSFSFWAGWRGCNLASQYSEDAYQIIGQVPLSAGRSVISDELCDPWMELTNSTIPPAFWKNDLQDEKTWEAIRKFSQNCAKRKVFERTIRKDKETPADEPVVLPRKVPVFELTMAQARQLVTDKKS